MKIDHWVVDEESEVYSSVIKFSREIAKWPISDDLKECDESILEHNYNIVLEYLASDFAYLINVLIFKKNKSYISASRQVARTLQRDGYTLKNFNLLLNNCASNAFEDFKPHCSPLTDVKMNRNEFMSTVFRECDRNSRQMAYDLEQGYND